MIELTQCSGDQLILQEQPERIISLVPSITENLILFGKKPLARTSFCIEPEETVNEVPVIGGTKTPRVKKIISMKPDLVIANKEENTKEHVEEIQSHDIPVWVTFQETADDLVPMMSGLSMLCSDPSVGQAVVQKVKYRLRERQNKVLLRSLVLIWKDPWMAVGKETYTSDLLRFCGIENVVEGRYPVLTEKEIMDLQPDFLILPSEPYAFGEKDQLEWNQKIPTFLFCGEDLLWSGPRFLKAADDLAKLVDSVRQEHS